MVRFHPVNRTMTIGTFLFIVSLVVLVVGSIFHANGTVLAYIKDQEAISTAG